MKYNEVEGNLIELAIEGKFDVIAQGVNCMCTQKSGLAPQMVKAFETNKFPQEFYKYKGDINRLGTIDYKAIRLSNLVKGDVTGFYNKIILDPALYVVNAYTQFMYGVNHEDGVSTPLDYHALKLCFMKMNYIFGGMHIGLPMIGCGLAGGNWEVVRRLIKDTFTLCDVTVVKLNKIRTRPKINN